jgi:hypothetical protein
MDQQNQRGTLLAVSTSYEVDEPKRIEDRMSRNLFQDIVPLKVSCPKKIPISQ